MAINKITKSPTPTELVNKVNEVTEAVNGGGGLPLGTRIESISKLPPAGTIRADDGAEWTEAVFPTFFQWLLADGQALTCTYAEWQDKYTTQNGNIAEIAVDTVARKFKMPIAKAGVFVANKGDDVTTYQEAGLPNAVGGWTSGVRLDGGGGNGVFATVQGAVFGVGAGNGSSNSGFNFDLSRASSIYGKSTTVTPENIRYYNYMVVANLVVSASDAQMIQITSAMANKANNDLSNVSAVAKQSVANLVKVIPDYSAGITLSPAQVASGYVAPAAGIVMARIQIYVSQGFVSITINNVDVGTCQTQGYAANNPIPYTVNKNDIFKVSNISGVLGAYFFPFKGGN